MKHDVVSKYAGAEIAVTLLQSIKRGAKRMAVYRMDYPSLGMALDEIGDDLLAGQRLDDEEMAALIPYGTRLASVG